MKVRLRNYTGAMRTIGKKSLVLILCLSFMAGTSAAGIDWKLKRDRDGIRIYTGKVEGSKYKAVRGVMEIDARLSSLVALVLDAEACPEWGDRCAKSYVHNQISETEALVYTLNDLPWPVSDRDVLARVTWVQDSESGAVQMRSVATEGLMEVNRGIVRLKMAQATWSFTPLENGRVEVVTYAHLDPEGPLPGWVTNMLLVDSPFKTLVNMRELVARDKYKTASVSFVTEPGASSDNSGVGEAAP